MSDLDKTGYIERFNKNIGLKEMFSNSNTIYLFIFLGIGLMYFLKLISVDATMICAFLVMILIELGKVNSILKKGRKQSRENFNYYNTNKDNNTNKNKFENKGS